MAESLQLKNVTKRYASQGPDVLDGLSWQVSPGESVSVVGPSGCGKSTLLNLIGALDVPTEGEVLLGGENLAHLDERELARVRAARVGMIFQLHHLLPQLTILENVLVPAMAAGGSGNGAEDRARRLLDRVGLAERIDHVPGQLSGGERQRAAVVRALINEPGLLLADEPTGSLDRARAEELTDLLLELNREEGVTLIVVTHAENLADRMAQTYQLRDGKLHRKGDSA